MSEKIKNLLSVRFNISDAVDIINSSKKEFNYALELALGNDPTLSWRAAWVLNHTLEKDDKRLERQSLKIIKSIKDKNDGHQRELLKLLQFTKIMEKEEGYLFDICVTIWESIHKSPSVRITAFRYLANLAKKYPELSIEFDSLTQKHYFENLSPGIKNSFEKILLEIKKPSHQ